MATASPTLAALLDGLTREHTDVCGVLPMAGCEAAHEPRCTCGADSHSARVDELRRRLPVWRKEPPTADGWYWWRDLPDCPPRVIRTVILGAMVYYDGEEQEVGWYIGGEWAPCPAPDGEG